MNEMTDKAISVLHIICNNTPMSKSNLARRTTCVMGMLADERNDILKQLVELGHVDEKVSKHTIGKRPPTYYFATKKGRATRDKILEDQQLVSNE